MRGNELKPIILGQVESTEVSSPIAVISISDEGIVTFDDPAYPPDPRLDIIGETEILAEGTNYIVQPSPVEKSLIRGFHSQLTLPQNPMEQLLLKSRSYY